MKIWNLVAILTISCLLPILAQKPDNDIDTAGSTCENELGQFCIDKNDTHKCMFPLAKPECPPGKQCCKTFTKDYESAGLLLMKAKKCTKKCPCCVAKLETNLGSKMEELQTNIDSKIDSKMEELQTNIDSKIDSKMEEFQNLTLGTLEEIMAELRNITQRIKDHTKGCMFEGQLYGSGCIRYNACNPMYCVNDQWLSANPTGGIVCPSPFTKVGEECFYRSESSVSLNWDDARTYCIELGGDLATPESVTLLREYLEEIGFGSTIAVWIGANDRDLPGYWRYLNGQQINQCDWSTNPGPQPDFLGVEQCLEIRDNFFPSLNNYICSRVEGFVCQYGASECPT